MGLGTLCLTLGEFLMKKTLIALAAVAAVGTSFAQVTISGGASVAFQRNFSGSANGIAMTDNSLYVSASENLGDGMKASAAWSIENDTARGSGYVRGDQSIAVTSPAFGLVLANTRSGGSQGAALVAPANLKDDVWTSAVITRSAIDVVSLSIPLNSAFTVSAKYIEGGSNEKTPTTAVATAYQTYVAAKTDANKAALAAAIAKDAVAGDGNNMPGAISFSGGVTYAANGLKVVANVTQSTYTENAKAFATATTGVTDFRTVSTDAHVIYDAGFAKVGLGYDGPRRGKDNCTDEEAMLLGVSVPMGKTTLGLNYGKRDAASFLHAAAQYDLTKRTNLNLSYGMDTQSATSGNTDQYRLSLNHAF
jgi:hypothetical protein